MGADSMFPRSNSNEGDGINNRKNDDVYSSSTVNNSLAVNNNGPNPNGLLHTGSMAPTSQQPSITENGMMRMDPPQGYLPVNMASRNESISLGSWTSNSVLPQQFPNMLQQGSPVYVAPRIANNLPNLSQSMQLVPPHQPQPLTPGLVVSQVSPINATGQSTTNSALSQQSRSPAISDIDTTGLNNPNSYDLSNDDADLSSEYRHLQNDIESTNGSKLYSQYKYPKRNTKACDMCRNKKIRCGPLDSVTGQCNNCTKRNIECTFNFHMDLEKKRLQIAIHRKKNKVSKSPITHIKDPEGNASLLDTDQSHNSLLEKINDDSSELQMDERSKVFFDKLLRKINILDDIQVNSTELIEDLNIKDGISNTDEEFVPKCKHGQYKTSLLTSGKLKWIGDKLNTCRSKKINSEEFYRPIKQQFNDISKWYIVYLKKLANFECFLEKGDDGNFKLFDLPENREQINRILENFHTSLIHASTAVVTPDETKMLLKKYYNKEPMDFSEKFLLNTCLIYGIQASFTIYYNEGINVRKDKHMLTPEQMKKMDHELFINCAYFYSKMMTHSGNLFTVKALLIWAKYMSLILGYEVSDDIFTKAVYIMQSLGLHKEAYYDSLPKKDFLFTRALWWYCISIDRLNSLRLSRPPLILFENNCSVYVTEEIFLKDFNKILVYDDKPDEQLTNFKDAINYAVTHHSYLRVAITYFGSKLVKLETEMIDLCFNNNAMLDSPFDEHLDQTLKLYQRFKKLRENLHPLMRLETFRDYYKVISVQNTEQKPEYQFEVVCSRVLAYQFRSLSAEITLNLFIISLIDDNMEYMAGDPARIEELKQLKETATTQYTECSRKILKTFCALKHQPFMYRECVFFFYTALLALIFKIIDGLDNEKLLLENIFLLEIIHKPYSIILERDLYTKSCQNMKWNAGFFIYTYVLKNIVGCFEGKNVYSGTFTYGMHIYDASLKVMRNIASQKKDAQVALCEHTNADKAQLSKKTCKIFDDLSYNFIDFLKDNQLPNVDSIRKYVFNNDPNWQPTLKKEVSRDCSLFTPQGSKTLADDDEILNDSNSSITAFPDGSFMYDRDFFFRASIEDWYLL